MSFETFYQKLIPYFSERDIFKLNERGHDEVIDSSADDCDDMTETEIYYYGRDYVFNELWSIWQDSDGCLDIFLDLLESGTLCTEMTRANAQELAEEIETKSTNFWNY